MFKTLMSSFIHDESGATAIEYGLIVALVSVAAMAALSALGDSLSSVFDVISATLSTAAAGANAG